MLSNISWQGYWITLALLCAGYYAVIYLLYYRNDFSIIISKKNKGVFIPSAPAAVASFLKGQGRSATNSKSDMADPGSDGMVQACIDELAAYFEESRKAKVVKEEYLYSVQRILSKYPALKGSVFQEPLSKLIVSEAKHTCSLHLHDEDVFHVWLNE